MNKSVLVTGAVKNTGLCTARLFAKNGFHVFVTSRRENEAIKTANELTREFGVKCFGIGMDPGRIESIEPAFQKVTNEGFVLDSIVLNSANQGLNQNPLTVDISEWAAVINTNVVGSFLCARTAANSMIKAGKKGTIVFMGSITYRNALVNKSAYIASKGGILSLTKALAIDFGQYGIRVNCLIPGPIYTERYDALSEEVRNWRNKVVPIGAVSTGDDIAGGVYFLATEQSGNATGSGLIIDGGVDAVNGLGY